MSQKRIKTSHEATSSRKTLIIISVTLVLTVSLGLLLSFRFLIPQDAKFSLKAAIIDQLATEFPNPTFVANITTILEDYGFNVSYHSKSLNVDFFEGLAKSDWGLIILRAHSAMREDNSTVDIFTSEEFSQYQHTELLENGYLVPGSFYWNPEKYYYAITSRFIENLEGSFPKSIVVAMGCWSLYPKLEQMARAFIDKGASAYIGWTNAVLANDTDYETLRFVQRLLNENMTLAEAVSDSVHRYNTAEGVVVSKMSFFPTLVSRLRISDLIAQAKTMNSLPVTGDIRLLRPLRFACMEGDLQGFRHRLILEATSP